MAMRKFKTHWEVLCLIPNVIGYIRMGLWIYGWCCREEVAKLVFFALSGALDCLDGFVARRFNQESSFGAWLDVTLDIFLRGTLWLHVSPSFGLLLVFLEFSTFASLQANFVNWQLKVGQNINWLARATLSKGFRTIPGVIAMFGIWGLPYLAYVNFVLMPSLGCRLFGAFVELCVLKSYVVHLLNQSLNRE